MGLTSLAAAFRRLSPKRQLKEKSLLLARKHLESLHVQYGSKLVWDNR